MIEDVIDKDGAIHENTLVRRIADNHGFQRAGRQIHAIVLTIRKRQRRATKKEVGLLLSFYLFFIC